MIDTLKKYFAIPLLVVALSACGDDDAARAGDTANGGARGEAVSAGDSARGAAGDDMSTGAADGIGSAGAAGAGNVGVSDGAAGSGDGGARSAAAGGNAPGGAAGNGTSGSPGTGAGTGGASVDARDEGARILQRTSAKYESARTMRADFSMTTENPLLKSSTRAAGRIYQQRPDRIALRFTQPDGDMIVGDGTFFWVYTPSTMKGQVLKAPAAAAGRTGVDLQAQFVGNPTERFNYTLHGAESVGGRTADVLTLVPKQAAPFRSLKVWVDREDALVRRFEFTERNGIVRRMQLDNLQVNAAMPNGIFTFSVPAGVRVLEQ